LNAFFIFPCTYFNEYRHKYLNLIEMDVSKQTLFKNIRLEQKKNWLKQMEQKELIVSFFFIFRNTYKRFYIKRLFIASVQKNKLTFVSPHGYSLNSYIFAFRSIQKKVYEASPFCLPGQYMPEPQC
jgi:hypothetical protein